MIDTIIKIIGCLTAFAAIITAIIGVIKYINEKNRAIYERRLNEVYGRLFGWVVKQEKLREIMFPDTNLKEYPILSSTIGQVKTTTGVDENGNISKNVEMNTIVITDRNNFVKHLNDTNVGLARPRLLKLINEYEVLIALEENLSDENGFFDKVTAEKVNVEYELVTEIIEGYHDTIRKLGLDENRTIMHVMKNVSSIPIREIVDFYVSRF